MGDTGLSSDTEQVGGQKIRKNRPESIGLDPQAGSVRVKQN